MLTSQPTIHAMAQMGDVKAIQNLLEDNPHLVNERDEQNVTPLHWAAINAHIGACRLLLDEGADIDAIGGDLKATALQWAAR